MVTRSVFSGEFNGCIRYYRRALNFTVLYLFSHTHVFLVHVLVCCILGSSASLSNMPDDNEPGAKAHPKGGYTPGMFRAVKCVDDFAAVIRVPSRRNIRGESIAPRLPVVI